MRLLTQQVDHIKYEIFSCTDCDTLLSKAQSIKSGIFFLDYYLEGNKNSFELVNNLRDMNQEFSIAIISKFENFQTYDKTFIAGASTFILKDKNTFDKVHLFLNETINQYYTNLL